MTKKSMPGMDFGDDDLDTVVGLRRFCFDGPAAATPGAGRYSLLATACITPPQTLHGLVRIDPEVRLADYCSALGQLLALDDPMLGSLVILENSGFDPELLGRKIITSAGNSATRRRMEILSYRGPLRATGMHYGFSEFQMIDHLLGQSALTSNRFVKLTGRYRFPGLSRLVRALPPEVAFACDSQAIPALFGRAESRTINAAIFVTERGYYDSRIRKLYRKMQQAPRLTHAESIIFDSIYSQHGKNGVLLRLPVNCEPVGIGGNGQALDSNRRRIRASLRAVGRRLLPGLWI